MSTESKICTKCGADKALSEYYFDSHNNKLTPACNTCIRYSVLRTPKDVIRDRNAQENRDAQTLALYLSNPAQFNHAGAWPEEETWKQIPTYEGYYEASDFGRIRSLWFINGTVKKWRMIPLILLPFTNPNGYQSVTLVNDGDHVTEWIHRLVPLAFCGLPPDGHIAGHRDGNPSNNSLSNLRWITYVQNEADKREHGRMMLGSVNHQAKLDEIRVAQMLILSKSGVKGNALAKQFSVSCSVVSKIVDSQARRMETCICMRKTKWGAYQVDRRRPRRFKARYF